MLTTTNPEIVKIYEQIDNCIELKAIIQNKIDQGHPISYLDSYSQPCGTVGCILGDWVIKKELAAHYLKFIARCDEIYTSSVGRLLFGFSHSDAVDIFGTAFFGTYQERLTRLEAHIQALHEKAASLAGVAA